MSYAEGTKVPVARSRAEIEGMADRYGADEFQSGWSNDLAFVKFRCYGRFVRFIVRRPDVADFSRTPKGRARAVSQARAERDREHARRWRSLALLIKAKFVAIEDGVCAEERETGFEVEFLPYIVLPDNRTVAEHALPFVADAYKLGAMPSTPLLGPCGQTDS